MKKSFKPSTNSILTAVLLVGLIIVAYAFVPQVLEGKIVDQSDISGYVGMAQEAKSWDAAHPDDKTAWTGAMFSGMPTTMITGNDKGDFTQKIYDLFFIARRPASYLAISLVGGFLLLLAFGVHPLVAAGGAVAITFCSYNFQIIQVGHNAKMVALAWAPWVLAAIVWTYRSCLEQKAPVGKVLLGASLFAFALNFQIKANHVQISYYLAIIILCYALVLLVDVLLRKEKGLLLRFAGASAALLLTGSLGIAANANRLLPTWEYSRETMRGGSALTREGSSSKGLDLDYATAWSYGWEELPNLMIPNFNGGSSSGAVNPDKSATVALLRRYGQPGAQQVAKALPLYWGPQPFTAGPMYMGAISVFLFILGLGLYRGKEKWWLLLPTLIGIGLALGYHFMPFTKFWYYHVPFYNKFRTVSMALVILQFTLPLLGFLVLDKILKAEYDAKALLRPGLAALGLCGGLCLLTWLWPSLFGDFRAASDSGMDALIAAALAKDRMMLASRDAFTSLVLILAVSALIWWIVAWKKDGKTRLWAVGAVCLLVLINMFSTGKRYLNSSHFTSPSRFQGQFDKRPADEFILADAEEDFRVLDLTANVFNDSHPSYWHKNIGGYSPVKLQRYQDLIDYYLTDEIRSIYKAVSGAGTVSEAEALLPDLPVLSMLNNKYIILDGNAAPVRNRQAMGPAWFVDSLVKAANADEEILLLGGTDLRSMAVIGAETNPLCKGGSGSADEIRLTGYRPNQLDYDYSAAADRVAVFSEIYYPKGWKAFLEDGSEVELFRCNWTLRAAVLPPGNHSLTLRFDPPVYRSSSRISSASSLALILLLLLSGVSTILTVPSCCVSGRTPEAE